MACAVSVIGGCALDEHAAPDIVVVERGARDRNGARLLSMQAHLRAVDYATRATFDARLRALFEDARERELLNARTVVVLPEYVGTWLVALDEDARVYDAETIGDALTWLALAHAPAFAAAQWDAPSSVSDASAFAAFTVKSAAMRDTYVDVMSALADEFDVTLVAGSILLPAPRNDDGALAITPGAPLENVSAVFDADGALLALSHKTRPTADELPFVRAADTDDIAVVDTPAGKLGVLVCADAWFPASYARLLAAGAELLAVPTFHTGDWDGVWRGYSGHAPPDDVDARDVGALTEAGAWDAYALAARAPRAGIRAAVSAPLRGDLWDLHDDGQAFLVDDVPDDGAPGFERAPNVDAPGLFLLNVAP